MNNVVERFKKRIALFTIWDWIEVTIWGITLLLLIIFSIIAVEIKDTSPDGLAALALIFAIFLCGSLVYTVMKRVYAKKHKRIG